MLPDDHFTRAIGGGKSGAESGADVAQKGAQQGFATRARLFANSNLSTELVGICAESCESMTVPAKVKNGEGGKLTTPFLQVLTPLGFTL